MTRKVIVKNIESLSSYCACLEKWKTELETTVDQLAIISSELQEKASVLGNATRNQGNNWQDPQYDKLESGISPCVSAVNATSEGVSQTAAYIKKQMSQVESSIVYIKRLVAKLNDLS